MTHELDKWPDQHLGIDGYQAIGRYESDHDCCLPKLCELDPCAMACNFLNLLPRGPLWDNPKMEAFLKYQRECGEPACLPPLEECTTLAQHAIYTGFRLYDMLMLTLYPALRESNPYTACTSMDDWLSRLGWVDCFRGACRDPEFREITPYDDVPTCVPTFCERAEDPPKLAAAVKHAIIVSLWRARLGFIKNVAGFNWVLEPLGAQIVTDDGQPVEVQEEQCPVVITIKPTSTTLPCWQCATCLDSREEGECTVPASFTVDDKTCNVEKGKTVTIWPGLLAAECILRSHMLRGGCDGGVAFKRET